MSYQKLQVNKAITVTPSDTNDIEISQGVKSRGCVLYVGTKAIIL